MSDCQGIIKVGYKLNSEAFSQKQPVTQAALSFPPRQVSLWAHLLRNLPLSFSRDTQPFPVLQAKLPISRYMIWVPFYPPAPTTIPLCSINFYVIVSLLPELLKCPSPPFESSPQIPSLAKFSSGSLSSQGHPTVEPNHSQAAPGHGQLYWLSLDGLTVCHPHFRLSFLPLFLSSVCFSSNAKSYDFSFQHFVSHISGDLISSSACTALISKISTGLLFWNHLFLFHILQSFPWMLLLPLSL